MRVIKQKILRNEALDRMGDDYNNVIESFLGIRVIKRKIRNEDFRP